MKVSVMEKGKAALNFDTVEIRLNQNQVTSLCELLKNRAAESALEPEAEIVLTLTVKEEQS